MVVAGRVRGHVQNGVGEGVGSFGVTVFAHDGGSPRKEATPCTRRRSAATSEPWPPNYYKQDDGLCFMHPAPAEGPR
jgi:hypothetical protein